MAGPKFTLAELRNLQEDDDLDMSARGLSEFPQGILQLTRLTKLDLSNNLFYVLSDHVCKLNKLVRLDLAKNKLHHLPDGIGNMTSLQHLSLLDNEIEDLPLSFGKLKSLKWLDLKKNPLTPKLLALAGPCNTSKECEKAARQVVDVYMVEQQKTIDNQKAQEAKQHAKVAKAQEQERIRKYAEKKAKEAEAKEKDAKRESGSSAKGQHQPQQHAQQHKEQQQKAQSKKEASPQKGKKDESLKKAQKSRGIFGTLFSWSFTIIYYIALALGVSATIAIGLDCKGMGNKVPGNEALCKDLTSLISLTAPSAQFPYNLKKSYTTVLSGYRKQAEPHVAPATKWASKKWAEFVKTDIGKKVEQVLYKIHAFIVDTWVKVQHFIVKQWNALAAWWKKDGKRQFGPAVDGFFMGMKMVFNIVIDIARNIGALFVHLAVRVKTFFAAFADGGFQAAMNTLNH